MGIGSALNIGLIPIFFVSLGSRSLGSKLLSLSVNIPLPLPPFTYCFILIWSCKFFTQNYICNYRYVKLQKYEIMNYNSGYMNLYTSVKGSEFADLTFLEKYVILCVTGKDFRFNFL